MIAICPKHCHCPASRRLMCRADRLFWEIEIYETAIEKRAFYGAGMGYLLPVPPALNARLGPNLSWMETTALHFGEVEHPVISNFLGQDGEPAQATLTVAGNCLWVSRLRFWCSNIMHIWKAVESWLLPRKKIDYPQTGERLFTCLFLGLSKPFEALDVFDGGEIGASGFAGTFSLRGGDYWGFAERFLSGWQKNSFQVGGKISFGLAGSWTEERQGTRQGKLLPFVIKLICWSGVGLHEPPIIVAVCGY